MEVILWGRVIGVADLDAQGIGRFEFVEEFLSSGIEVAPLHMPLRPEVYRFPHLPRQSFHGLPGLLVDSLPDKFGNALIDIWLAQQGRSPTEFTAIERLCYMGTRGMGALEFRPVLHEQPLANEALDLNQMVSLASDILNDRASLRTRFAGNKTEALQTILRIGTSAGGARAKAVIAWNPDTQEVRSGQIETGSGFEHWLLKFDGVQSNRDKELEDPKGYSAIEYAYYLMACACGIDMMPSRLLEEHGRRHFLTKRFDRSSTGEKIHLQSLAALDHADFNHAGSYSYERCFQVMRELRLGMDAIEQQFRRMCFNIVARNQDDHVKNISFLMNQSGQWSLSPAYDLTYSYNPFGEWTAQHQMTLQGKRREFTLEDFLKCGKSALMKRGRAQAILEEVVTVAQRWTDFASQAKLPPIWAKEIAVHHRLRF